MSLMIDHLQQLFLERCRSNERYSMRAFAQSLNVPVSSLSEVMNQKRPLTTKLRDRIGKALNMSSEQIRAFKAKEHGNRKKECSAMVAEEIQQLTLDSFYIVSEWYHYGILQLLKTSDFTNDPKWIARRLNIDVEEVETAIERLVRIGILEKQANGELFDSTEGQTSHLKDGFTNEQLRAFQVKALQKGIEALQEVPIDYRDNTSMTMAVSKRALPFAKKEITRFRRQLTKKLEAFEAPDEVYQLAISLTPLTQIDERTK